LKNFVDASCVNDEAVGITSDISPIGLENINHHAESLTTMTKVSDTGTGNSALIGISLLEYLPEKVVTRTKLIMAKVTSYKQAYT
jgi:hypothetical protein